MLLTVKEVPLDHILGIDLWPSKKQLKKTFCGFWAKGKLIFGKIDGYLKVD